MQSKITQIEPKGTYTNASGEFEITGITPRFYTVSASKSDYYMRSRKISVLAGSAATADIALRPTMVTDIDGNTYQTVQIGNQIWLAENLKVTHYRNGTAIPQVADAVWGNVSGAGALCDYDNDPNNAAAYGRLYRWDAATQSDNLAPQGCYVPSDAEWQVLIDFLGGRSTAGGKMKEVGTTHWLTPNNGATNESGFSGLPGGFREANFGDNRFLELGTGAHLWSTTESVQPGEAFGFNLDYFSSTVKKDPYYKGHGLSVRCVMN